MIMPITSMSGITRKRNWTNNMKTSRSLTATFIFAIFHKFRYNRAVKYNKFIIMTYVRTK